MLRNVAIYVPVFRKNVICVIRLRVFRILAILVSNLKKRIMSEWTGIIILFKKKIRNVEKLNLHQTHFFTGYTLSCNFQQTILLICYIEFVAFTFCIQNIYIFLYVQIIYRIPSKRASSVTTRSQK